jgi:hypothetical protein
MRKPEISTLFILDSVKVQQTISVGKHYCDIIGQKFKSINVIAIRINLSANYPIYNIHLDNGTMVQLINIRAIVIYKNASD